MKKKPVKKQLDLREVTREDSCVLAIEFQNQWTGNTFYNKLIGRELERKNVIPSTEALLNRARSKGIPVIQSPLVVDPECKKGWLAHLTFGKVFTKNSENAAFTPGIFQPGDQVVQGRYAFDAFKGSNLKELLDRQGIKTLFVSGFITDQCVAKTVRTAEKLGFRCYVVSDCTATVARFLQNGVEKRFDCVSSGDVLF